MTVQEAIVDFTHQWIGTGRQDLGAFAEAMHQYFTQTVIDGTPAAQSQGTRSGSGTGGTGQPGTGQKQEQPKPTQHPAEHK